MKEEITIEEFIISEGKMFSKRELEKKFNMPEKTLQRVATGGRMVPQKYRHDLIQYFKKLGKDIKRNVPI